MYFDIFQIVRDSKDRVFTWGFGGYGRLGHQQPKDEHVPRLVSFFKGKSESKRVVFLYCLLLLLLSIFFSTTGIIVFVLNTLSEIFSSRVIHKFFLLSLSLFRCLVGPCRCKL